MYHNLIVDAKAVFHRLTKFYEVLEQTDYIGFFHDIESGKLIIFFGDPDELMRGYEILDEWLPVNIGIPLDDVDKKYLWRE